MTLGELEIQLKKLGYYNFQFHIVDAAEVEVMVELDSGHLVGVVGSDLTTATEALLSKLEHMNEGVILAPESYR